MADFTITETEMCPQPLLIAHPCANMQRAFSPPPVWSLSSHAFVQSAASGKVSTAIVVYIHWHLDAHSAGTPITYLETWNAWHKQTHTYMKLCIYTTHSSCVYIHEYVCVWSLNAHRNARLLLSMYFGSLP